MARILVKMCSNVELIIKNIQEHSHQFKKISVESNLIVPQSMFFPEYDNSNGNTVHVDF